MDTTETIKLSRADGSLEAEIGLYVPDDGINATDIQYVTINGRILYPVPNETAIRILNILSDLNYALTDVVPQLVKETKKNDHTRG